MNLRSKRGWVSLLTVLCLLMTTVLPIRPTSAAAETDPDFITSVIAASSAVKSGQRVSLNAIVTAQTTQNILVNLEIFDSAGERIFQQFTDHQPVTAGEAKTVPFVWDVPATQASGTYTVSLGIFKAGWVRQLAWHDAATTVTITEQAEGVQIAAQATPNSVTPGEAVEITVNATSTAELQNAFVEVSVFTTEGFIVAQDRFSNVTFETGEGEVFPFVWSVPEDIPSGLYSIGVEVLSGDHNTTYAMEANVLGIQVNAPNEGKVPHKADVYETSAYADPEQVEVGSLLEIAANVKPSSDSTALINVEIYSPSGVKIQQKVYDHQALTGGIVSAYPIYWSVPRNAERGIYSIQMGIFKPGWGTWNVSDHAEQGMTSAGMSIFKPGKGNQYDRNLQAGSFVVTDDLTAPGIPADITAVAGDGEVTVTWSPVTDLDLAGYKAHVSTDGGVTWSSLYEAGLATSYTITGLTNGTPYTFAVSSFDHDGNESETSIGVPSTPIAPTPVETIAPPVLKQIIPQGDGKLIVVWQPANESTPASYMVYLSSDMGQTWNPGISSPGTFYPLEGLTQNKTYMVAVTALDSYGNESLKSNKKTAIPVIGQDRIPPAVPTGLLAAAGDSNVSLTWAESLEGDLQSYRIYMAYEGQPPVTVGSTQATSYLRRFLQNGVTYSFYLTAIDIFGNESSLSAPVEATPAREVDKTPPPTPAGLVATAGDKKVDLSWDGSQYTSLTDFAGFRVYRSENGGAPVPAESSYNQYTATGLTNDTVYAFTVTAYDTSGNESAHSASLETTPKAPDRTAPAVPTGVTAMNVEGDMTVTWNQVEDIDLARYMLYVSEDNGTTWDPAIDVGTTSSYLFTTLKDGIHYAFAVTAVDTSSNESAKSEWASLSYSAYRVPKDLKVQPGDGTVMLSWTPVEDARLAGYKIYISENGGTAWKPAVDAGQATNYVATGLTNGQTYTFAVTAISSTGKESAKSDTAIAKLAEDVIIPVDPASIAPALSRTGQTSFSDAVSFLYEGDTAIQLGVKPGAIEAERVTVLRGSVTDIHGTPLSGVKITVLSQSEVGRTYSLTDGLFDIAANSKSTVTVQYEKPGYMTIQRKAETLPHNYSFLQDAVMTPLDTKVTEIQGNAAEFQVAQANPVTDQDGTRQASLLFAPGTTATMKLADGTEKELTSLNVRATEYTVGERGQEAMPGELTNMVAYTYAVELSADEAIAADANQVTFNKPVYVYVDNFLHHPAGILVPNGYYNRSTGSWEAQKDGVVIKVVDVANGLAQLDVDGDDIADGEDKLAQLGLTEAERAQLASLYTAGQSLWRVPVEHFSSFDFNQVRAALPADFIKPPYISPDLKEKLFKDLEEKISPKTPDKKDEPIECKQGSLIGCEQQSLGQSIPIAGTPFNLIYDSKRAIGYQDKNLIAVPVTDNRDLPAGLKRIEMDVYLAGKRFSETFGLEKNQKFEIAWDGKDAFDRSLVGKHPYFVEVRYIYKNDIEAARKDYTNGDKTSVFGRLPGGAIADSGAGVSNTLDTEYVSGRDEIAVKQEWNGYVESPTDVFQEMGIAGWKLTDHQFLNDYNTYAVEDWTSLMPSTYTSPQGVFAQQMVYGEDGNMYYTIPEGPYNALKHVIYRIKPNGSKEQVSWSYVNYRVIAVGNDGTIFATNDNARLFRKKPNETEFVHFAGGGDAETFVDGSSALDVALSFMSGFDAEVGPDGSLFFIKNNDSVFKLTRIDTNGRIFSAFHHEWDGNYGTSLLRQGGLLEGNVTTANFGETHQFEIGSDGTIYDMQSGIVCTNPDPQKTCVSGDAMWTNAVVKIVSPDGTVKHAAGKFIPFNYYNFPNDGLSHNEKLPASIVNGMDAKEAVFVPREIELDDNGNLYFADQDLNRIYTITPEGVIHQWDPETVEKIKSIAGPNALDVDSNMRMKVQPDGTFYFWTGQKWLRVSKKNESSSDVVVPGGSGTVAYKFDGATGRHLQTLNGTNGKLMVEYLYDSEGRLTGLKDSQGKQITVERDEVTGTPTAIVAPNGERTILTVENGQLKAVENPIGETYAMAYDDRGLMESFTDPKMSLKTYQYDDKGFLTKAITPELGEKTLARTELEDGHQVTFMDPDGRVTTYKERYVGNEMTFTTTEPTGEKVVTTAKNDGTVVVTYADGSTNTTKMTADPQWGMAVQYASEIKLVTAENITSVTTVTREAALADPANPFSVTTAKTTVNTDGNVSSSYYDAAAHQKIYTGVDGEQYIYTFDENDRLVREAEGNGGVAPTEYAYDEAGRVKSVTQGTEFLEYTYDSLGRIETVTDAAGKTKRYGYDSLGRVERITTPEGKVYRNEYDGNGRPAKVVMPDGTVYGQSFTKNGLYEGLLLGEEAAATTFYSAAGLKDKTVQKSGREISYVRDPSNNYVIGVNDPDIQRAYGYDENGRMDDASTVMAGGTQGLGFTYYSTDLRFGSMEYIGAANGRFEFGYDNLSNLSNIHAILTSATGTATFDVPLIRNPDDTLAQYGPFHYKYEGVGKRFSSLNDEKLNVSVSYDGMGRIDGYAYTLNGVEIYRKKAKFNNRGLLESNTVTTPDDTITYVYTYDGDGQLTSVTRTSTHEGVTTEEYGYDANKNLTSRKMIGRPDTTSVYGDYDTLQQVGDLAYVYDADGHLSKRGEDTFHFATKGELLEATVGGEHISYAYDALSRRTSRTDASGTTQYLYGNPLDQNLLTHSIDPQGVVTAYLYNGAGLLIAIERNEKRYYVITDAAGTPELVLDDAGTVVKQLRYDSFGVRLSDSNQDFALEIGFAGGLEENKTGLVRFGLRDYDPAAGRWTSRDPIGFEGNQANLYAYAHNNPVSMRDPGGTSAWGAAMYIGVGGGLTYHLSPQGWRVCAEMGFGAGGAMTTNPEIYSDLPANESFTFDAGASFSAGPFASLEIGEVYDLNALSKGGSVCSNTDFVGKGNIGPLTFDDEEGFGWDDEKPSDRKSAQKDLENLKKFKWNKPQEWEKWGENAKGQASMHLKFTICTGLDF